MTGNIVTYLNAYGDRSLTDFPLNDVDALALCQLSYLKFDTLVPILQENQPSVSMEELYRNPNRDKLFVNPKAEKENQALLEAMCRSRRFGKMGLNCYINIVEKKWETQFSAITCILPNQTAFIVFRGTDENIVGWKEDLNLAYMDEVPGQSYAVRYLNGVAARVSGDFYVGGHSKGGNLSVYSAMMAAPAVQERILKVYSMDGPGLGSKIIGSSKYAKIKEKIVKILPQSSLVGMMLEQDMDYSVIYSRRIGITQHDPYSWVVEDSDFLRRKGLNASAYLLDQTINQWVESLEGEERKKFLDTLYTIIDSCEGDTLLAFTTNMGKNLNHVLASMKNMDEKTAQMMRKIVKALGNAAMENIQQEIIENVREKFMQNDNFFSGRKE